MLETPLVTIGVPTYNRPISLERTLKCLVSQTYNNLEIIVSDNCSTNEEVELVLTKYKSDIRVVVVRQEENMGAVYNSNVVLEKATGYYFMRLNDDDWLDLNYIETCVNFLQSNLDYAAAYGVAKLYTIENKFFKFDSSINMEQNSPADRVKYYLKNVTYNSCYYGLVKRDYAKKHYFLINRIGIDWVLICRTTFLGKFKLLSDTNSYISTGGLSSSTDGLTANLNMPMFTRSYPNLTLALNIFKDISWESEVYKLFNYTKRQRLAFQGFSLVFKKHNVKEELWPGTKKFIKYKFGLHRR